MKTLVSALGMVLLIGSTTFARWYVAPPVVAAYYPVGPVYAYPPAVVAAPAPYVAYMPTVVGAPPCAYGAAVVAPTPVVVGTPAVIRARVFYPGQPVRNVVKAVVP
jgi:hypothetical protein